jgi:hypothetical protein
VARLNDDAQWIILMGFLISFSFFFLALIINQSTVVGQTTAESIIEFPKNDIRDFRGIFIDVIAKNTTLANSSIIQNDLKSISLNRKNAVVDFRVWYKPNDTHTYVDLYYNNGVTLYNETWASL